jgi:hypothetical protein
VRQHDYGRCLCLDLLNGFILLHVRDTVDDRVDFASKSATMLESTLGRTKLDLPPWIEVLGTRKNHIGVMLNEYTRKMTKRNE